MTSSVACNMTFRAFEKVQVKWRLLLRWCLQAMFTERWEKRVSGQAAEPCGTSCSAPGRTEAEAKVSLSTRVHFKPACLTSSRSRSVRNPGRFCRHNNPGRGRGGVRRVGVKGCWRGTLSPASRRRSERTFLQLLLFPRTTLREGLS